MATQTIIPALANLQQDTQVNPVKAKPPACSYPNLRRSFGVLGFFAVAAATEALIPKFRGLLWQLPYFATPVLVSAVFNYLRDFHPDRVPSILAHDSPLRLKLQRIRNAFGWTAFLTTFAALAVLLFTSKSDACTCENHPALFIVWLATDVVAFVGCIGLSAYLRERSQPQLRPSGSRALPRTTASNFKPIQSDHWGQPTAKFLSSEAAIDCI
jgi:hypothetical protein